MVKHVWTVEGHRKSTHGIILGEHRASLVSVGSEGGKLADEVKDVGASPVEDKQEI